MSFRLGLILSSNVSDKTIIELRKKYNLGIVEVNNSSVSNQLLADEKFFQATETGFDDYTGIGAYHYYSKDVTQYFDMIDRSIADKRQADFFKAECLERREGYKKDTLRWINIFTDFKFNYKINIVGVFGHMYSSAFNQEKIVFKGRKHYDLTKITFEDLMKVEDDVIACFY